MTEDWQHYVAQPAFRPDLSLVAVRRSDREIAGLCMVAVNEPEIERLGVKRGWIDILAVRRQYRRNGLGRALILAGMRNLRKAGVSQSVLGCDSENLTGATRIYERVGFRVNQTHVSFRRLLRVPVFESACPLTCAERVATQE